MRHSRAGVTLIELLIVILTLTTLILMITFTTSSMKSTARANQVINDMYAWKTAVLMWLRDNNDAIDPANKQTFLKNSEVKGNDLYYNGQELRLEIPKYLSNAKVGIDSTLKTNIFKIKCDNNCRWFVCYDLPPDPTTIKALTEKLAMRAKQFGLIKSIKASEKNSYLQPYDGFYSGGRQSWLYLLIVDFNE